MGALVDNVPKLKAAAVQGLWEFLDEYRPGLQAEALARVGDASAWVDAPRSAWLTAREVAPLQNALVELLGPEAPNLWRDYGSTKFISMPFVRTLAEGALRMTGASPTALLRFLPYAWKATYRGMATPHVACDDYGAVVRLTKMPAFVREQPGFAAEFEGGVSATLAARNANHTIRRRRLADGFEFEVAITD